MKKIIVLALLLFSGHANAITQTYAEDHVVYTTAQIATTSTSNVSDTVRLGAYQDVSFQCVWAAVTGAQPRYKLQVSNNDSNWDDVTGAVTITTGTSGSETWIIDSLPVKNARVKITTASTTGTLDCVAVAQGR